MEGAPLGPEVGPWLGGWDGPQLGDSDGLWLGEVLGPADGPALGALLGAPVGPELGDSLPLEHLLYQICSLSNLSLQCYQAYSFVSTFRQ